jgi:cytochrome c
MFVSSLIAAEAMAVDLTRAKVIVGEKCRLCHGLEGEASTVIYPVWPANTKSIWSSS